MRAESAAVRLERRLACVTVGAPALGFLLAMVIVAREGIGALELGLLLGMYLPTALGVEAGFHRYFAHRAFRAGRAVTSVLAVLGSMAAQGPVLFWASTHRRHHAFTDREGDPHSPCLHGGGWRGRLRGLWHAHVGWLFTHDRRDWMQFVPDLIRDPLVFRLNQHYFLWVALGLALPAAVGACITGSWRGAGLGLLWGGLVRIFLLDQATWGVNSLAHWVGARLHATRDNSRNLAVLALFSVGGSWHNNHHAQPALARTDHRFWQVDLAGWFIELLALLRLAWNVKRASPPIAERATHAK